MEDLKEVFEGNKEPDEKIINFLQNNREELIKWIGRCAWHCKKVEELSEENEKIKREKEIYKKYWGELLDQMLKEFDNDGWCRLTMKKEDVLQMKKDIESDFK